MKTKKYAHLLLVLLFLIVACTSKTNTEGVDENKSVLVIDPVLLELIDENAELKQLATGFQFTEGPAWSAEGFLVFSDIPANKIHKLTEANGVSVYQEPSYNSNGLLFTGTGDLLICEHSSRLLRKVNATGIDEVLADQYQGLRLNSPNDLALKSDGSIYFTDPPYGLSGQDNDPEKELSFNGIYRYKKGELYLIDSSMVRPNGIAFSPDERTLYVTQSEIDHKWMKFSLDEEGKATGKELFYDANKLDGPGTPDGLKVDAKGYLFCSGPGGIVIFSPDGKHLGTVLTPEVSTNCAFGGTDGKTLFITAQSSVYAIQLK